MRRISMSAVLALGLIVLTGVNCSGQAADAREGEVESSASAPELTDAQIAHVAVTANAIDVELARLVESRSTDDEVQSFAETMIGDHTGVNERAAALAERLGVTPEDNAVSRSLREGAAEARESLVPLSGEAFDRAYMQREVEYHQAVLDALDGALIPGASNAELRGLLEQVRPAIAAHLERARGILAAQGG
jgi:putative membrane protein